MQPVLDETVVGRNHFWMKTVLDESVFGRVFSYLDESVPKPAECRMHNSRCLRRGLVRIHQSCWDPLNEAYSWPELLHNAAREAKHSADP